jgi:hypothetical protein
MSIRRWHFSTGQKIGLALIAFIWLWRSAHDPFIIEAILSFGLAGEVPGTSIVLSPDQVMALAGGLIALVIGIVAADVHAKHRKRVSPTAAPIIVRLPIVRPTIHRHVVERPQMIAAAPLTGDQKPLDVAHHTWIGRCLYALVDRIRNLLPYVRWARDICIWAVSIAVRAVYNSVHIVGRWTVRQSRVLWQRLSPYLWRFDAWLGVQFHRSLKHTHHRLQQHDTTSVLLDAARDGRRLMRAFAARYRR